MNWRASRKRLGVLDRRGRATRDVLRDRDLGGTVPAARPPTRTRARRASVGAEQRHREVRADLEPDRTNARRPGRADRAASSSRTRPGRAPSVRVRIDLDRPAAVRVGRESLAVLAQEREAVGVDVRERERPHGAVGAHQVDRHPIAERGTTAPRPAGGSPRSRRTRKRRAHVGEERDPAPGVLLRAVEARALEGLAALMAEREDLLLLGRQKGRGSPKPSTRTPIGARSGPSGMAVNCLDRVGDVEARERGKATVALVAVVDEALADRSGPRWRRRSSRPPAPTPRRRQSRRGSRANGAPASRHDPRRA